jgi:hypothetical protein
MGSMFFQQISLFSDESTEFYITKNVNALEKTYIGTEVKVPGPSPF